MDSSPSSILLDLLFIIGLILLNAFFAASEMAIVSLNKNRITYLANEENNNKAKLLLKLLEEPSRFLATIQIGITIAGFMASASAATTLSHYFATILKAFNVPASEQVSLIFITIILAFITLVLGELFPKRVALQNSQKIALAVIGPIIFISKISFPFVKFLTATTNLLLKAFGLNSSELEEKVSEEEIRMMINVGEESGVINETEKEMLDGIFQFDDTLAKEIMTPRTNVFSLEVSIPIQEIIDSVLEEQYSRIPVYKEDTDDIIGVLYMKDLFTHLRTSSQNLTSIESILRPAYFVPETKNIDTLFKELQSTKNHMAILIDEYGGFSGIVTIEDLIEEVMGNIFDEHDESDDFIKKIDNNNYLINGLVSINEVNELFNLSLPSDNYDTIGGFVIDLLGSIPGEDEQPIVTYEDISFKIENVSEKRIEQIKLSLPKTKETLSY